MVLQLLLVIGILFIVGVTPVVLLRGINPETLFLAPIVGAMAAGFAATAELVIGETLIFWFAIFGVLATSLPLGCVAWARAQTRLLATKTGGVSGVGEPIFTSYGSRCRKSFLEGLPIFVAVASGVLWPLQALSLPYIGYDANAIWIMHSLLISGGHQVFVNGIHNAAYSFSNPDYPPLVSAVGAIAIVIGGRTNLALVTATTAVLNSCALGAIGCGIAGIPSPQSRASGRVTATLAGAVIGLAGFAYAGIHGVSGYADLLWAAEAAGSVLFGLVLPMSWRNCTLAWLLATAAALTKNEGMVMAPVLLGLLAIRYVAARPQNAHLSIRSYPGTLVKLMPPPMIVQEAPKRWVMRVAMAGTLSLPAIVWPAVTLVEGVKNAFFSSGVHSPLSRVPPIIDAMASHLLILPIAGIVAALGMFGLLRIRKDMVLGRCEWLWIAIAAWMVALFATYDFGSLPIHWWLSTSITRTLIFVQLTASIEIVVWAIVAITRLRGCLPRIGNNRVNQRGITVPSTTSATAISRTESALFHAPPKGSDAI